MIGVESLHRAGPSRSLTRIESGRMTLSGADAADFDLIGQVHRERGATVVVVTHDESAAARASRVIAMRDGRVEPAA